MDALVERMQRAHGLDLGVYDLGHLGKTVEKQRLAKGCATLTAYLELLTDRGEAEGLVASLANHHSELFREPLLFAQLEQRILPALATTKGVSNPSELRVWSAGCAAGQEAYSLAILLLELSQGRDAPVPFRIFATDLSTEQLALAKAGTYAESALRNVRLGHLERWFTRRGATFEAVPELRERVSFSRHDLLDADSECPKESICGQFDLVLCCNVLFYYRPDSQRVILDKLGKCLVTGGVLATGQAERNTVSAFGLQAMAVPSTLFRKVR
ncbi:MAG: hypothetical protein AUK47_26160 [Deltaproteobacteria bacterium CG2_30_63_29]|nr:MAG: hypothetical protein AUK47_26160 [Deltaproteobacteria bacterium CG2_30_63_29]